MALRKKYLLRRVGLPTPPLLRRLPPLPGPGQEGVEEEALHRGFFSLGVARGRLYDDSLSRFFIATYTPA